MYYLFHFITGALFASQSNFEWTKQVTEGASSGMRDGCFSLWKAFRAMGSNMQTGIIVQCLV
jgi:hypothetical protein